jgi:hypothetical protein
VGAAELLEARSGAFRTISWRTGTKGPLRAEFAAIRVRVADGPVAAGGRHLPGEEAWLVGEHRATGERKYYLSNLPPDATLEALAALIKARWVCEQMHQQLKGELGLGHFEGRSWRGLHHHALLCQLAFAFLQHLRLGGKSAAPRPSPGRRQGRACPPSGGASWRPSPAPSCAARTAGSASSITSGSEPGSVVLGVWLRNVIGTRRVGLSRRTPGASTASGGSGAGGGDGLMLAIHPERPHHPGRARRDRPLGRALRRAGRALRRLTETVRKWRKRGAADCRDRSSRPHRLPWKATEEERAVVCALRRATGFPLDDLTFVVAHFLPHLDRDNVYRILKAAGLSRRPRPPRPSGPRASSGSTSSASSTWT